MPRILDLANPMIIKNPEGEIYLRRYFILETRWINIFLHYIGCSDLEQDLHDHPWRFVSIILKGGYTEHTLDGVFQRHPGQIIFRSLGSPHRLELSKPAWTLVITGRNQREWGFVTSNGWVSREEHKQLKEELKQAV